MHVSSLKQLSSFVVPANPAPHATTSTAPVQDTCSLEPVHATCPRQTPSVREALAPSRGTAKPWKQTLTRGLAAASILSGCGGAASVGSDQRVLGKPILLTPGEDMFKAYLGDWRCITYAKEGTGDAWTKFTTPPSWEPNAVRIWWDDLDSEWREGFLVDLDPIDATHGHGDGPWLRKRHDNNVLPTWGNTDLSAEKTDEGWRWTADVKLRDSDAHWIEFHEDKFDPTGASFSRDRRVHHVDQDWWHNDTVLCTILPSGPRAAALQDKEKMTAMGAMARRDIDEI